MGFTQIITVEGADEAALHELVAEWDTDQAGVAPGYRGARVLADDEAGQCLIEVDFTSEEDARRNNDRSETQSWAASLGELVSSEPGYRNLRQVCTTYGDR